MELLLGIEVILELLDLLLLLSPGLGLVVVEDETRVEIDEQARVLQQRRVFAGQHCEEQRVVEHQVFFGIVDCLSQVG